MSQRPFVVFTMAYHSGMGRVASALAAAAGTRPGAVMIAPDMDVEPAGIARVRFARSTRGKGRLGKVMSLLRFNLDATRAVWRHTPRGAIFLMVDLFSTVPLSVLPALAARLRGAVPVLNLHDFYPHAPRYPAPLRWLERYFFRSAYRHFDRIATMTSAQATRLVREAGYPAGAIVPVDHGAFPIEGVRPAGDDQPLRVLLMGSIRRNKQTLSSIEAIVASGVRLRLAGAPRPEERDYWALCEAALAKVPDAEVTARFIPDEALGEVLSDVSAMLCPYEDFDSASGVGILAVTNQIPLIATACAVPEDMRGARDAWLAIAEPVSTATIADALRRFQAMTPEARRAMAEQAHTIFTDRDYWQEAIAAIANSIPGCAPRHA
jgi:glycosyltransferase involved in cell wall biosynthesis